MSPMIPNNPSTLSILSHGLFEVSTWPFSDTSMLMSLKGHVDTSKSPWDKIDKVLGLLGIIGDIKNTYDSVSEGITNIKNADDQFNDAVNHYHDLVQTASDA